MLLASLARNWWIVLLRGIFAVLFGICVFARPGLTLYLLILLFGIYAIVDGLTAVFVGLSGGDRRTSWWQMLLVGSLSVVAGVVTLLWPHITAVALLAVIAAWSIVRGIAETTAAIRLRSVIDREWLLILSGACSILFGLVLFARPGIGALAVLWVIGIYALVVGFLMIALAFELHALRGGIERLTGGPTAGAST